MDIKKLNFPNVFDASVVDLYLSIVGEIDWTKESNLKPHGRVSELLNKKVFLVEEIYDNVDTLTRINNWVAGQYDSQSYVS